MTGRGRSPVGGPIAFGHRGALAYAPGNTIEGFRLALAQGASGLETDARLAADGVPVLAHDATIRQPDHRIVVSRRTSTELAALGVPTLAELYEACGTAFELSIDVEHRAVARPLMEVAARAGAIERLWLCHDDVALLGPLRAADARVRLVHSTSVRRLRPPFADHCAALADRGVDALNLRWRSWSPARVDAVHDQGLLAFAWDANDRLALDRMLDLGVDAIYADRPDRLVAAIAAMDRTP